MIWQKLEKGGSCSKKYHVFNEYHPPGMLYKSACGQLLVLIKLYLSKGVENPPEAERCKCCLRKVGG